MYDKRLETFIQVAESGSFTKAAGALFISAPAVIKQMNQLEEETGITIFERTSHGVKLTAAGTSLCDDAKSMIRASEEALSRARRIQERRTYTIRVGSSVLNPCTALLDLWVRGGDLCKDITLDIVPFNDDYRSIIATLTHLGEDFDILIGAVGSMQWRSTCSYLDLGAYRICCAVPRDNPLASRTSLTFDDLEDETLYMSKQGDIPHLDALRDNIERNHWRINLKDAPFFYDINLFNRCAQEGAILLSLECWDRVHPAFATIPLDEGYSTPYGICYPKTLTENVMHFIGIIKTILENERYQ